MKKIILLAMLGIAATTMVNTPANARGLLAGFAKDIGLINEDERERLDRAHAAIGNPLDHLANQAAGAALDSVAPGFGSAATGILEGRDAERRAPSETVPHFMRSFIYSKGL